jgi:fluoride ion exporter CrcB/FEX
MSTTNINVKILAEMLGIPSLNKGAKAVSGLEAGFKKLAGAIGIGLGTAEIVNFGKQSLAAFTADEKAAAILAQTLKNVGQGFADVRIEKFITNTSLATGILKNDLRDAFDSLVRQTHNAATAQDLLNTAINVASGSGKDLSQVSASLAKAYGGQTAAIARLNVGLTKADLTGKSFAQIQAKLNALFAGQAGVAADTYAGKIKRLGASFEEAKVTIGKGMVDAFTTLSTSSSFDSFVNGMQTTALAIADIYRGMGDIDKALRNLPGMGILGKLAGFSFKNSILGYLQSRGAKDRTAVEDLANQAASSISTRGAGRLANQTMAQQIADQKAAAAALIKSNAEKTKQLKLDTAIAFLKKSMAVFDQQKIQIAAALANSKLTADEKARLQLMQTQADLQQAIDDKNTTVLDGLMSKIKGLQDSLSTLQKTSIGNPFAEAIKGAMDAAAAFGLTTQAYQDFRTGERGSGIPGAGSIPTASGGGTTNNVTVTVNGSMTHDELAASIQQAINNNTASGIPSTYDRNQLVAW